MRISKSLLLLLVPSSESRAAEAHERNGGQGGFTLIELLAVLLILSILVTFLVRSVRSAQISVEVGNTKALIQTIGGLVEEYNNEFQRYPPSTFPASLDPKPNRINMGAEMLVISLWRQGRPWQAADIGEDALGNTDLDSTKTSLTRFSSADAFELTDVWGNPLAYIHRRDYEKEIHYLTYDEVGLDIEGPVKGRVSIKTGDPHRKSSFQIISAGPDGIFGNADDIANFEIERD